MRFASLAFDSEVDLSSGVDLSIVHLSMEEDPKWMIKFVPDEHLQVNIQVRYE